MNNYTNYVIAHKDFTWNTPQWYNDTFTQSSTHRVKINLKNAIVIDSAYDDKLYGEITYVDWILKNCNTPFVSINHYRRILNTPVIDQPVFSKPINLPVTMYDHFSACHSKKLIDDFIASLTDDNLKKLVTEGMQQKVIIPYNLFSGPLQVLAQWYNFVAQPIIEFMKGIKNVKKYVKESGALDYNSARNNSIEYQKRIAAFLSERMSTIFWTRVCKGVPGEVSLLEDNQRI